MFDLEKGRFQMKATINGFAVSIMAVLLSTSLAVAGELEHVGNIRPDGNMDGKLFSQGCRGGDSANVCFVAKVEGGVIEGYVNFSALTRGRPNSYEIDQR
jgi:cytoskeletal protein CcmA (bactofilin family)